MWFSLAGFHSTKNIKIPTNIYLLRIPPYSLELNPCEQIWKYMKTRFKNQLFKDISELRKWLWELINKITKDDIKSITGDHHYFNVFQFHL